MIDGFRLALSTLTVWPVRVGRVDRRTAGAAMLVAPLVGAGLGVTAAAVLFLGRLGLPRGSRADLLPAALAVVALALMTRALHLDGLADTADAFGVRDRSRVLAVMRAPEVGAFGVVVVGSVLLVDAAAVALATSLGRGTITLVCGTLTGRLAVTWACRTAVPPARPDGLGALVAGTVRVSRALPVTVAVAALMATAGAVDDRQGLGGAVHVLLAMAAGLAAGEVVRRRACRLVGGVTGDVLGAVVEVASAVAFVVLAFGPASNG